MGAQLPDLPNEGTPLAGSLHRFAAQVVAWMRAHTPVSSPTVRVRTSTAGTAFEATPRAPVAAPAADLPFVFYFRQDSDTGGTWVKGKAYIAGVDTTITSQPTTISGVTTTTYYWILHNFAAGTLTWKSGASYTDANSDSQEVYRMLEITCADSVITAFVCPHPCDIHATAKST